MVTRTQDERAARLLARLAAELTRRQDLLAAGGFAGITEQRAAAAAPAQRLPHIFVLLDRWEGFTTTLGDRTAARLTDVITRILAEGASAGIHLVMTGDRSLLAGRIAAMCEDKLVFKLADRDDYALAGLRPRDLPDDIPPGRAFRAGYRHRDPGRAARPRPLRPGPGRRAAADRRLGRRPGRRRCPRRCGRSGSTCCRPGSPSPRPGSCGPPTPGPLWGLVGVGGDELTALGPDLSDGTPAFIVAGPARSGRSTMLASMTRSFLAGGAQVILVTPRPSPLRSLAAAPGVARLFAQPDLGEDELAAAIASLAASRAPS